MKSPCKALTKDDIVAGINLTLHTPGISTKVLVIVEGDDDKKLYSKLFDRNNTEFKPTYGCENYEFVLEQLKSDSNKFIILKDADFDHLNKKTYTYPNLFLTDTHDLETMMVNETVMRNICIEYLEEEIPDFTQSICLHLKSLSYIKWYNNRHGLSIKFDALKISSVYNCEEISISDWLKAIYNHPANSGVSIINEIDVILYKQNNPTDNYLLLINGHDLCDCISKWLKKHNPSCTNVNKNKISQHLRMNYNMNDFRQTKMYKDIHSWGQQYSYKLFT